MQKRYSNTRNSIWIWCGLLHGLARFGAGAAVSKTVLLMTSLFLHITNYNAHYLHELQAINTQWHTPCHKMKSRRRTAVAAKRSMTSSVVGQNWHAPVSFIEKNNQQQMTGWEKPILRFALARLGDWAPQAPSAYTPICCLASFVLSSSCICIVSK